ncbi:MAG: S41 family peptidase, partial [Bdellovibrionota bacterium]
PGVSVLRLASFAYRNIPETDDFATLRKEVDAFYEGYWKKKAPTVKKLVIDLLDNGGGDTPVGWYEIFLDKPFQEMGVEFKKLPELENSDIRRELFYRDAGKEIWFTLLMEAGSYEKIKAGGFLPEVPQFCATEDKSCEVGLHQPQAHGFKGEIRLLVNEWCISSCTGFVWQLKDKLGSRVKLVGMPDSGDSAYARLYLDLYLDASKPEGFRLEVTGRKGQTKQQLPEGAILRHQVAVTRSTDLRSHVMSAIPTRVDEWIPIRYREFDASWEAKVFKAALAK